MGLRDLAVCWCGKAGKQNGHVGLSAQLGEFLGQNLFPGSNDRVVLFREERVRSLGGEADDRYAQISCRDQGMRFEPGLSFVAAEQVGAQPGEVRFFLGGEEEGKACCEILSGHGDRSKGHRAVCRHNSLRGSGELFALVRRQFLILEKQGSAVKGKYCGFFSPQGLKLLRFLGQTAQLVALSAARLRFAPHIIGKEEAQFVTDRRGGLLCRIPWRG